MAATEQQQTAVWIRDDVLANASLSPTKPKTRRRLPVAARTVGRGVNSAEKSVWGWSKGCILSNTDSGDTEQTIKKIFGDVSNTPPKKLNQRGSAVTPSTNKADGGKLTILVTDPDSDFNNMTVQISQSKTKSGDVVMDNHFSSNSSTPDDLIQLTHLHEPAVVQCLERRYREGQIYTSTGPILLALNPFRMCEGLYDENIMKKYWHNDSRQSLPPHVYATADEAFKTMMRQIEALGNYSNQVQDPQPEVSADQCVLVSGESGAGKTVTTKFIMKYLATLSQKMSTSKSSGVSIEQQVLESNPILESFGNARTLRNDNSSRFGKFIEMSFAETGGLLGATISTYLLEKVRLVRVTDGERNYHVFYELLSAKSSVKEAFFLKEKTLHDFRMTSCTEPDRRDGVKDKDTFYDLLHGMQTMGFDANEQHNIFQIIAALLHLSNITFVDNGGHGEGCILDARNPSLMPTCTLLGVSESDLNIALTTNTIECAGERVTKFLSINSATKAKEALLTSTYSSLFQYIVQRVNHTISNTEHPFVAVIGVLDIFGFESFLMNGFEQLCINYCNEKLQQQFNKFVFKLEQEEYEREGIEWSFIQFPDNQDVLDLISAKRTGILSLLDEQCRLNTCTNATFANQVYSTLASHDRLEANRTQRANNRFTVSHYAGPVEYTTDEFLEKNKDELPQSASELLSRSQANDLLVQFGANMAMMDSSKKKGLRKSLHSSTIASQFTSQLKMLSTRIDATTPHYIRCLKPNEDLIPNVYDKAVIADQLKCNGILEAIRVSRVGYPQRFLIQAFVDRYSILHGSKPHRTKAGRPKIRNEKEVCAQLVQNIVKQLLPKPAAVPPLAKNFPCPSPSLRRLGSVKLAKENFEQRSFRSKPAYDFASIGIQIGKTKVFLCQKAFDSLERLLSERKSSAATRINAIVRGFLGRLRFHKLMIEHLRALEAAKWAEDTTRREVQAQKLSAMRRAREEEEVKRAALRMQKLEEHRQKRQPRRDLINKFNEFSRSARQIKSPSPKKYRWKQVGPNW
eukprot:CAMPEP_0116024712 /NCGR_PEP_ID=MMETSP0321-20121206/12508_1 /TAXON_ID=163516 /ORGANISM="Leptocylindrus danicus var. danicus, Strain B650" /LENGTH=1027 /DNA_ID=CAMNT_0003496551 /DNA_START=100 /DNA_END=3180 /DNA_ORIENTATION=+